MSRYQWSESWTVIYEGEQVSLHAGSDLSFSTAFTPELEQVIQASRTGLTDRPADAATQAVFDQLLIVGAITLEIPKAMSVAIRWVGSPFAALIDGISIADDSPSMLLIRTNGTLSDVMRSLENSPATDYLFVDAAYHHTFSLGPFATVGAACAACLAGRLRERWGDDTPPTQPGVLASPDLLNAILRREVVQMSGGRPTLTNATSTWDLATGQSKREALYRVPSCPACEPTVPNDGRVSLPWTIS